MVRIHTMVIPFLSLLFIYCNDSTIEKVAPSRKAEAPGYKGPDTMPLSQSKESALQPGPAGKYAKDILGIWALKGTDNANFIIEKTKINYPDHGSSYAYLLKGDSIYINYKTYKDVYHVNMKTRDTLVLERKNKQVYYRFKKGRK